MVGAGMSAALGATVAWLEAPPRIVGAAVDLNSTPRYIHWGFFQMSVANFLVVVAMIVVFVVALFLPFPGGRRSKRTER
jgi:hypothetical protein